MLLSEDSENPIQEYVADNPEAEDSLRLQRKLASEAISRIIKEKKEISWTQSAYLDKVHLQNFNSQSVSWMLDRKASVGPCFTLPHGEPSGITICLPKKSSKKINENINSKQIKSGGININVSKRCLGNNTKFSSDFEIWNRADRVVIPRKEDKKIEINNDEGKGVNLMENLKGKLNNWRGRIKHALHL